MTDEPLPEPGAWNRFSIEVDDLTGTVARLRAAGVPFPHDIVTGAGGKLTLIEDPSGNPVELFEPTRADARLHDPGGSRARGETYQVQPIGWVESTLVDPADAPHQGHQGAPDAWLVITPEVHEGIRDLQVGSDIFVLTWLHQARRDELATQPGDDPTGPERGVFSTRSPARPNPVGLHRATILAKEDGRLRVHPLEAVDGTHWSTSSPSSRPTSGPRPRTRRPPVPRTGRLRARGLSPLTRPCGAGKRRKAHRADARIAA